MAPAFSVTVNDGSANSNTLAATITYTPVNDVPVLDSAAQEEANGAGASSSWPAQPMADARAAQVSEAGGSTRIFKRVGTGADDLAAQLEEDPRVLWALTRPVETRVGLGLANLDGSRIHPVVAAVLVVSTDAPGAFDLPQEEPATR